MSHLSYGRCELGGGTERPSISLKVRWKRKGTGWNIVRSRDINETACYAVGEVFMIDWLEIFIYSFIRRGNIYTLSPI
jgi:hypothetical protein